MTGTCAGSQRSTTSSSEGRCGIMVKVKARSAHSGSASSSGVTLGSTTRRLYRDGIIAATVSKAEWRERRLDAREVQGVVVAPQ